MKPFFEKLTKEFERIDTLYPSIFPLTGLICAVAALESTGKVFWLITAALIMLLCLIRPFTLLKFAGGSLLGLLACLYFSWQSPHHYERLLPPGDCGAVIKVRITDSSCAGDSLYFLKNPNLIYASIEAFGYSEKDKAQKVSGAVILRLPPEAKTVTYNEVLTLKGAFIKPEQAVIPGLFDFNTYLRVNGVKHIFNTAEIISEEKGAFSIQEKILDFRNAVIGKLCDKMQSQANQNLCAAIMAGFRQGIPAETRNDFIKAGTVHIFTVSGLHTGMLALIVLFLLSPLPFRYRYFILPVIVFLYVATTGMQAPAVRALIMISVWSVMRGMLYMTPGLNTVFLSAFILLLCNPFYVFDAGFQYSFITVGFLLASWRLVKDLAEPLSWKLKMIPGTNQKSMLKLSVNTRIKLLKYVAGCLIAWLATAGLSSLYQGFNVPFSIGANIILIPVIWLAFVTAPFIIPASTVPGGGEIITGIVELLFNMMSGVCSFFAGFAESSYIGAPPEYSVCIFYLFLAGLCFFRKTTAVLVSVCGLTAILLFWNFRTDSEKPEILIMHGGDSQEASFVIRDPSARRSIMLNCPGPGEAYQAVKYLKVNGCAVIDFMTVTAPLAAYSGGIDELSAMLGISSFAVPANYGKSSSAKLSVESILRQGGVMMMADQYDKSGNLYLKAAPFLECVWTKTGNTLEYSSGKTALAIETEKASANGTRHVSVSSGGKTLYSQELKNSLFRKAQVIKYE